MAKGKKKKKQRKSPQRVSTENKGSQQIPDVNLPISSSNYSRQVEAGLNLKLIEVGDANLKEPVVSPILNVSAATQRPAIAETSKVQNSDFESYSLGEEDTDSSSDNCSSDGTVGEEDLEYEEVAKSGDERVEKKTVKQSGKPSHASLFEGNRIPSNGKSLRFSEPIINTGMSVDSSTDAPHLFADLPHCLVGYFAGRYPGHVGLRIIVNSWKTPVRYYHHSSGWIVFKFETREGQLKVTEGGPYMVYGRPLMLKEMPNFLRFDNSEISTVPVWVQLRNLPIELWSPYALGKLGSWLGKPMRTDKITNTRERLSFARILVEVDLAKEVKHFIPIDLPGGVSYKQQVTYENLPKFCSTCKVLGHDFGSCKGRNAGRNEEKNATNDKEEKQPAVADLAGLGNGFDPLLISSTPMISLLEMASKPVVTVGVKGRENTQSDGEILEIGMGVNLEASSKGFAASSSKEAHGKDNREQAVGIKEGLEAGSITEATGEGSGKVAATAKAFEALQSPPVTTRVSG